MQPEPKRMLTFIYENETVSWQIERLGELLWQIECEHRVFIKRFGKTILRGDSLFDLLQDVHSGDEDYLFFVQLLISFMDRPPL